MKIDIFETHDRHQHLKKDQWEIISKGAEDCLKKNPDSIAYQQKCPYVYIFAHPRTADDGVTKRLLWQPRLSRPKPQTNSYLFRAQSNTDIIEVCWLLPPREMWSAYEPGKVTEDNLVMWSIYQFEHNREWLEMAHPQDLPDDKIAPIFRDVHSWKKFNRIK